MPLVLEDAGLGDYICDRMDLRPTSRELEEWRTWVERLKNPERTLEVAVVGKYVELPDAYLSVKESLDPRRRRAQRRASTSAGSTPRTSTAQRRRERSSATIDGIVVPGGFGERGFEGKVEAARYARLNNVPYLGLCLGLQVMVVEFARDHFDTRRRQLHRVRPRDRRTR